MNPCLLKVMLGFCREHIRYSPSIRHMLQCTHTLALAVSPYLNVKSSTITHQYSESASTHNVQGVYAR